MIIADGEVDGIEGRRVEETQQKSTGNWKYDSWESSCLAKFNEFLGFPTKGFEKEILELLRNLVASQKKQQGEREYDSDKKRTGIKKIAEHH